MKSINFKTILTLCALSFFLVFTSCDDDDSEDMMVVDSKDIVQTAVDASDLSILVEALQKANLVDALRADGPFTVFAPTNSAFQALLDSNDSWSSLDDIPVETLTSVLLYHVVEGKVASTDLSENQEITTLNNYKITVDLSSGVQLKTVAEQMVQVIAANVEAENGIIHIINEVMLPIAPQMDIVETAVATSDLSILVEALQKADLVNALSGDGPFTVFAPTNEAFQALLDSNESWNSLDDIPVETLSAVLLYHVVEGKVASTDLTDNMEVITLNTGKITVDLSNGVMLNTIAEQMVSVTTANVEAKNGIIHIINEVMLPIVPEMNIVEKAIETSNLSILVSAVQKADLVDALSGDGPFTVFAPTNEAFQALLDSNESWNSLDDIPVETLTAVLLYHVVEGKVASTDLMDNQEITTLNTGMITVDLSNGVMLNTIAEQMVSVTGADIEVSNGIIHIVDEVMLPIAPQMNIVETAIATPSLSILVSALQKANLVDALNGEGPFTVFAPTNDAFQALLDSNASWNSLDDIPVETLTSVLLFHVISGEVMSTDLSDTYVNTLATGPNDENLSLQVEVTGGVMFNGDAMPVLVDIETSNGIVHVIDKVMLPPSIVTLALNNSGFTTLVAALTDSRHTTDFVSTLSSAGPFTVFAPTNDAFQALLDSNADWNGLGDIPIEVLDTVLKYHVINGANVQASDLSNGVVTTFEGSDITIDLSSGAQIITESNQTVNILVGAATNDVQGTNGVVHAIDTVLIN